jgi:Acyl-ACP thioesterase
MNSSYKEHFRITCYDADHNGDFKPFAFMNHAQELANIHASNLGFGYETMIEKRVAWILSRVHVKFLRYPKWKETINIETWHKGDDRLFGLRDFHAYTDSGETLILATSSWVIIDLESRRIQRIRNILGEEYKGAERDAIKESAQKLSSPEAMEFAEEKRVLLSDIDINRHANNAKYVEWAIDHIDPDLLNKKPIKEFTINFNHESTLHQKISLYRKYESDTIFIEGRHEEVCVFQILITI